MSGVQIPSTAPPSQKGDLMSVAVADDYGVAVIPREKVEKARATKAQIVAMNMGVRESQYIEILFTEYEEDRVAFFFRKGLRASNE